MPDLRGLLCCPFCQGSLGTPHEERQTCRGCGTSFPFVSGTPSFLVPRYHNFFEKQWQLWVRGKLSNRVYGLDATQRVENILSTLGLSAADISGKLVLDAGTGHGEVARQFAARGGDVIGIDVTDVGFGTRGTNPLFILSDYFHCPFRPQTFDIIVSSGVVHHTDEPMLALASISRYLKKGGHLYLYVYEPGRVKVLRLRRLFPLSYAYPSELLYALSVGLAPFGVVVKRLLGGKRSTFGTMALGIHDALVPRYAYEVPPELIVKTLTACGFREVQHIAPCEYRAIK